MSDEEGKIGEKQQYLSMFICWLSYVIVYFGRFSYSANIGLIEKDYGVTHAQAGLVMTFFAVAYGAGQIIHGIFCVHYPRRQIVSAVLVIVGIINLFIFFGVPFRYIKYLWFITGAVQSILWPMLLQIISENIDRKHMSKAVIVMNTTTSGGTLIIYGVSAVFANYNYRLTFLFGTIAMFSVACMWYIMYKPGHFIKTKEEKAANGETQFADKKILIILPIALLCVFSLSNNFLKDGIQTWAPVILKTVKPNLSDGLSIFLTLVLPFFGIFGAVLSALINKKIPKAIPLVLFFFGFSALFNGIICLFGNNIVVVVFSFGALELLLHGIACVIVSIFPLSMREKMSTGALAGILNGSAYTGTAVSAYVLGKVFDISGTDGVFATLFGTVVCMMILGIIYLIIAKKQPKLNV